VEGSHSFNDHYPGAPLDTAIATSSSHEEATATATLEYRFRPETETGCRGLITVQNDGRYHLDPGPGERIVSMENQCFWISIYQFLQLHLLIESDVSWFDFRSLVDSLSPTGTISWFHSFDTTASLHVDVAIAVATYFNLNINVIQYVPEYDNARYLEQFSPISFQSEEPTVANIAHYPGHFELAMSLPATLRGEPQTVEEEGVCESTCVTSSY
jgi:hypothetical protein